MLDRISMADPDPIFGLNEAFREDRSPQKMNLGAGVYQNAEGGTPVLAVVKEAEARMLASEDSKSYLPIDGLEPYRGDVRDLLLGGDHPAVRDDRCGCLQAPGGTGALRLVAELWRAENPTARIWLSDPSWANHPSIFRATRFAVETYAYYDRQRFDLRFEAMLEDLEKTREGDLVVLHGVCHNPTGVDPSLDQWAAIGEVLGRKGALPLVDIAYQGFADGVEEDAAGLRLLARELPEAIVCSSFSKTLGLYRERVGAALFVAPSSAAARAVVSQAKRHARVLYSNPPSHGAQVAATVLGDAELRQRWQVELAGMRDRIRRVREDLVAGLDRRSVVLREGGNRFITEQRGMFSFTGLSPDRVRRLRDELSIYLVGSGRINVAGLNAGNLDRFCDAVAAVV